MDDKQNHINTENDDDGKSEKRVREHYGKLGEQKSKNQLHRDQAIIYVSIASAGFCATLAMDGACPAAIITIADISVNWMAGIYAVIGAIFVVAIWCVVASFSETEERIEKAEDRINDYIEKEGYQNAPLDGDDTKSTYNRPAYRSFMIALGSLTLAVFVDSVFC